MGLIGDIKAMKEVKKIKNGGTGNLSISQITGLITNMLDAKNNLDSDSFRQVYELFNNLRKCNTKMKMNYDDYCENAVDIIKRFDKVAPYEKYSGGNELEFSFLMNEIRNKEVQKNEKYAEYIEQNSSDLLSKEDSMDLTLIIAHSESNTKEETIKEIDDAVVKLVSRHGPINAIIKMGFLLGALSKNHVISNEESEELRKTYSKLIMKNLRDVSNNDKA